VSNMTVTPILSNMMEGSEPKHIDPGSCIPLFLFRKKANNAIQKLKAIFTGKLASRSLALSGIVSGTTSSIVVPLKGELEYLAADYFQGQGYCDEDIAELKSEFDLWYGIVDGNQFHAAIMDLRKEDASRWEGFRWFVTVVQPNRSLNEYRQLARIHNERNKPLYHFESTIYDLLHGLRLEYDALYEKELKSCRLEKKKVKIHHRAVACNYDGGEHTSNTYVKQAVSVASRLAPNTIEAIGEVCNMECPDIILRTPSMNKSDLRSVDQIISNSDCRLFRSFICFGALRGAKQFMNAVLDGHEEAQINCIYRLKHWCETNDFKPVQSTVVAEQFHFSILSIQEEKKFLELIKRDQWPEHMETVRENVLRTTLCDKELSLNYGNDLDILPTIWRCFKRLHPAEARGIESNVTNVSSSDSVPNETQRESPSNNASGDNDLDDGLQNQILIEQENRRLEEEQVRLEKARLDGDNNLAESGVTAKNIDFDNFLTEVWTPSSSRVDLTVSAIPKSASLESIRTLPSFCKTVLKSGSYAFFIVSNSQYTFLDNLFQEEGFKVMDYAFQILYDKSTMQRRASTDFPQRNGDIAILTKSPSVRSDRYTPIFVDKGMEIIPDDVAKFASFINVSYCRDKLKKPDKSSAIRTDERSVNLFTQIIKMLSPPNGSVIDPIGGTLTAAIACLETGRSCVCLENDTECFQYAVGRARIFATPGATMQQLNDYKDPTPTEIQDDIDHQDDTSLHKDSSSKAVVQKRKIDQYSNNQPETCNPSKKKRVPPTTEVSSCTNDKEGIEALLKMSMTS